MSNDERALEPLAIDADHSIEMLAAAIRADTRDLATFERVFVTSVLAGLPEGIVELGYDRSLSDRMAGRKGSLSSVTITLDEIVLELRHVASRLEPTAARVVRGVAISRKVVNFEAWSRLLAEGLAGLASQRADMRQSLERLLGQAEQG